MTKEKNKHKEWCPLRVAVWLYYYYCGHPNFWQKSIFSCSLSLPNGSFLSSYATPHTMGCRRFTRSIPIEIDSVKLANPSHKVGRGERRNLRAGIQFWRKSIFSDSYSQVEIDTHHFVLEMYPSMFLLPKDTMGWLVSANFYRRSAQWYVCEHRKIRVSIYLVTQCALRATSRHVYRISRSAARIYQSAILY